MQKILLFLIFYYQYQSSVALYTPIDYLLDKLTEFVTDVADTAVQLRDKLRHVFVAQRLRSAQLQPDYALLPEPAPLPSPATVPSSESLSEPSWKPLSTAKPPSEPLSLIKPVPKTELAFKNWKKRQHRQKMLLKPVMPKIENTSDVEEISKTNHSLMKKVLFEDFVLRINENIRRAAMMTQMFWKSNNISSINATQSIKATQSTSINATQSENANQSINATQSQNTTQSINATQSVNATHARTKRFVPMPKLAKQHGKRVESHKVITKDGYQLTLHRVKPELGTANKTVLLHHGLLGSSADWILLGTNDSLPYLLSASGYDVWLCNARGNYHSKKHVSLNVSSDEFWNFSWQEIGEYDLPATIDYIRNFKESNNSISFVGHSMGATALLALLAARPGYNSLLDIGVLLAPLSFMTNIRAPFASINFEVGLGKKGEFLPSREVPKDLRENFCKQQDIFCRNPLFFLCGGLLQTNASNSMFIDRLMTQVPSGGSVKTILHYAQLVRNAKFHKFDDVSLEYPLQNITLPIAIFSSDNDWLAPIPDVTRLVKNIVNLVNHEIIFGKNISHTEFVWGARSEISLFMKIKDILDSASKQDFTKKYEGFNETSIVHLMRR